MAVERIFFSEKNRFQSQHLYTSIYTKKLALDRKENTKTACWIFIRHAEQARRECGGTGVAHSEREGSPPRNAFYTLHKDAAVRQSFPLRTLLIDPVKTSIRLVVIGVIAQWALLKLKTDWLLLLHGHALPRKHLLFHISPSKPRSMSALPLGGPRRQSILGSAKEFIPMSIYVVSRFLLQI